MEMACFLMVSALKSPFGRGFRGARLDVVRFQGWRAAFTSVGVVEDQITSARFLALAANLDIAYEACDFALSISLPYFAALRDYTYINVCFCLVYTYILYIMYACICLMVHKDYVS